MNKKKKLLIWSAVVVVVVAVVGAEANKGKVEEAQAVEQTPEVEQKVTEKEPPTKPADNDDYKITLSEFGQIEAGMDLREVVDIIGMTGSLVSEAGEKDKPGFTRIFKWDGVGSAGANAVITFVDGVVSSKAQYGLE